jgi:arylformamidase
MSGPTRVWRDLDQAELDRQYNSRGTVADYTEYTRRYAELTRAAKTSLRCHESLRYGEGTHETLDLYPALGPNEPLMVFVHGGNWQTLSKDDSGFGAPAFVAAGGAFAALDFSVVPQATLAEMAEQVQRALRWLHAHAADYGCDPARIHIAGHSSGAQLVGQMLVADWDGPSIVKSATFMSGLGDLEPVRLSFRNAALRFTEADVAQYSLVKRPPTLRCPLIVAVGERETPDYHRQSHEVVAFWRRYGNPVAHFTLAERNHFDAVLEWADPGSALFGACRARMGLAADPPADQSA